MLPHDIPKSFKLLGHTWRISTQESLEEFADEDGGIPLGVAMMGTRKIILLDCKETRTQLSSKGRLQVFLHELLHAILGAAGRADLRDDEGLVDLLSELLLQVLTTARY